MVDISSLSGLSGNQQNNIQRANAARLQAAIANLVSGSKLTQASDDVAALSIATQLQSSTASLRTASTNLAQASSLTQVADGGIKQIQDALEQLKAVAQQAQSPTLNADNRKALNEQFKSLVGEIDRLANNTTFNNQKLLNGDLSGNNSVKLGELLGSDEFAGDDNNSLSVNSLTSSSLFAGKSLSVLSADDAKAAVEAISVALGKATAERANVGAFQQSVNYAAANIDSVVVNQEAAISVLQDSDFAESSTEFSLANLQRNLGLAIAAQGNRLSPALLKLVG